MDRQIQVTAIEREEPASPARIAWARYLKAAGRSHATGASEEAGV